MTPEQINIECAKLDGWTYPCKSCKENGNTLTWRNPDNSGCVYEENLPHYTTSYDAIIPLIQKQDEQVGRAIHAELILGKDTKRLWNFGFTPLELATALLKAKGLLK